MRGGVDSRLRSHQVLKQAATWLSEPGCFLLAPLLADRNRSIIQVLNYRKWESVREMNKVGLANLDFHVR